MESIVRTRRLATALAIVLATGCRHTPPAKTPEGTLALLRTALTTGSPPIARVADTRIIAEAQVLDAANHAHDEMGVWLTDDGLDSALSNAGANADAAHYFAGVATMLRNGHCERIGDHEVPALLRQVPSPSDAWPRRMRDLGVSVARRATNVSAAEFRCDNGPAFSAVFVRPNPDDGTLRVAQIGPASQP